MEARKMSTRGWLETKDGERLEMEVGQELDEGGQVAGVAVICHPHPLHGGDMFSNVVRTLARAASDEGYTPLMFNFRGAGRSTGRHTEGLREVADVDAAMAYAHEMANDGNVMLMGYSFGAMVATRWLNDGGRATCFVAVSVPVNADDPEYEGIPSLYVNGEFDDIAPLDDGMRRAEMVGGLHVIVEDTDHFFRVGLLELGEAVQGFIGISSPLGLAE